MIPPNWPHAHTLTLYPELQEDSLVLFRYHEPSQTLFIATTDYNTGTLKLYRINTTTGDCHAFHTLTSGKREANWVALYLSRDGHTLISVLNDTNSHSMEGGSRILVWEQEQLVFEHYDPPKKIRYSDINQTHMFFGVLHPDDHHFFFWCYGDHKLRVLHLPSREFVHIQQIDGVYAMNLSPQGDRLVLGRGLGQVEVLKLPSFKRVSVHKHKIGYYWWNALGVAVSADGNTVVSFNAEDRDNYVDGELKVNDYNSHLIQWTQTDNSTWTLRDAKNFRSREDTVKTDNAFDFKVIGNKIYFAGLMQSGNLFWMQFPECKTRIFQVGLYFDADLHFSEDATVVYCGNQIDELHSIRVLDKSPLTTDTVYPLEFPDAGEGEG
jgi:hypothetical protein